MKTFINKETEITVTNEKGDKTFMSYADLAKMSLNAPPQGGWTTDEMRSRIKITDKLEGIEAGIEVQLEDAEFKKVLEASKIKWKFMHKDIVAYEDHLLTLDKG